MSKPEKVAGRCNARLYIGDDFGDSSATIQCKQLPNHEGCHTEQFERDHGFVTITWWGDEDEDLSNVEFHEEK